MLQQSILKVEQVQKKNPEVQRICFTVIDSESPELLRKSEQAGGVGSEISSCKAGWHTRTGEDSAAER